MILKSLWTHKKQNGWIFAEITIITCLSWFMVDFMVTNFYATYFCIPAGEFEKDHLCVGQFGIVRSESASEGQAVTQEERQGIYVIRDKLKNMPEVASVCLTPNYLNFNLRWYNWRRLALAEDTTKTIGIAQFFYYPNQYYFETQGLQTIEGSPDAETLSREIPPDGIIVTRSIAQMLFGHDQVVGKRVAFVDFKSSGTGRNVEVYGYHTISGVVEDVKSAPSERYPYVAFFPWVREADPYCNLLLRLKSDVDAEAFVKKLTPTLTTDFRSGVCVLGKLETYQHHYETQMSTNEVIYTQLASVPLTLFGIIVVLGTLGTYWLQIRKRTEEFGILCSFGAKRRHIFLQIWGEGAILTALAVFVGCLIWFQFTIHWNVLSNGGVYGGSGRETDWVTQFWPHFLIICGIQFVLMLVIVTLGIIIPALIAMYKKPVNALRYE